MPTHSDIPPSTRPVAAAFVAIVTLWLTPRRTAARCQHTPLWAAWLAHLLAALIAVGVVVGGLAIMGARLGTPGARVAGSGVETIMEPLAAMWRASPLSRRWIVLMLAGLLRLEIVFAGAAIAVVSWSAQDEPLRQTCRHALRTTWLWTGSFIPFLVLLFAALIPLQHCVREWFATLTSLGQRLGVRDFHFWWEARPWLAAHYELVVAVVVTVLTLWILFVLLRAAATPRESPPRDRPPVCETCGYDLSHTAADSRCPECGVPVDESIGAGIRQPNAWERPEGLPRLGALVRCGLAAAVRPGRFFRGMQTRRGLPRARAFMIFHFALVMLVCPALGSWVTWWDGWPETLPSTVDCLFWGLFTLWWALSAASLVGIGCQLWWKQNVMPGVLKVFCYTNGLLVLLAIVCGVACGPMTTLIRTALTERWRIGRADAVSVIILAAVAFIVLCLLIHLYVALKGVRQIRHANS